MEATLVLGHDYVPLQQTDWKKAIQKVWLGVAVMVEGSGRTVRSVSMEIEVPSIIRLLNPCRKRRGVRWSRENVYLRDRFVCQYCGTKLARKQATLDHVVPRAQGGTTKWDNCVTSCNACNQAKGDRTPEQANMPLLNEPVKPRSLPELLRITVTQVPEAWTPYLQIVTVTD